MKRGAIMLLVLALSTSTAHAGGQIVDFGDPPAPNEESPAPTPTLRGRSIWTILLLTATLAGVALGPDDPETPRWTARNSFDESARNGLVASTSGGRSGAGIASDVLLGGLGAALATDWWFRGGGDRYGRVDSIETDISWILGSLLTVQATKLAAARERPYVRECSANPDWVGGCSDPGDFNKSFFSGHASLSATFAGLICARHLAPADRSRMDWAICGGAASASLATGLLRVVADKHYTSDVLVGWAVGAGFGYLMPRIFDYRGKAGPFSRVIAIPEVGTRRWGLQVAVVW